MKNYRMRKKQSEIILKSFYNRLCGIEYDYKTINGKEPIPYDTTVAIQNQ